VLILNLQGASQDWGLSDVLHSASDGAGSDPRGRPFGRLPHTGVPEIVSRPNGPPR